jgi:hypothetical protein
VPRSHGHRNRLVDGSSPFAMRSITTFEERLENCLGGGYALAGFVMEG